MLATAICMQLNSQLHATTRRNTVSARPLGAHASKSVYYPKSFPCVRQYLRAIAEALRPCGRAAAFYLAAAVSDFFIPWSDMVRTAVPASPSLAQHVLCTYAPSCNS